MVMCCYKMLYNIANNCFRWLDMVFTFNVNKSLILPLKINEGIPIVTSQSEIINKHINLLFMTFIWTILHAIYKKCCNVYFRKKGYSLVFRNRISNVLWSTSFTSFFILYILFLLNLFLNPAITIAALKSFYVHHAIIVIINNNALRGISNCIFIFFIFGFDREISEPQIYKVFLLKIVDSLGLECCRLLYLKWPIKFKQYYIKWLYIVYSSVWSFLCLTIVITNLLMFYKCQSLHENITMYLWFLVQFLEINYFVFIVFFQKSQMLEFYLFTKPSMESIYLKTILNNQRKINNSIPKKYPPGKQIWEVMKCAMLMKKKIRRLRMSKLEEANKESHNLNIESENKMK